MNNQITTFVDKLHNGAEKTYYTITDIQGSVTEIYDESQNLVWKSGYTAFGILACEVNNSIDFDGLYTGCDYDTETGLTYHWNRWRSEEGNSWLTQDPARDGLNWYGYAGQNPVNFIDVIGLFYYNADGQHSSSEEYEKKDITTIHSYESNNANDNLSEKNSFNTITVNGKKILTVKTNDYAGFESAANAYFEVLKYGAAENKNIDTIALTDSSGKIIHTFTNDSSIKQYANSINPSVNRNSVKSTGQLMIGVNLNFVGMIGGDVSIGLLFDSEESTKSGLFLSGGFAAGVSAGVSVFGGYNSGKIDAENLGTISLGFGPIGGNLGIDSNADISLSGGYSPIGLDAGFNISKQHMIVLPFATQEEKNKLMAKYYEHH